MRGCLCWQLPNFFRLPYRPGGVLVGDAALV
jgi:hypothetical protein